MTTLPFQHLILLEPLGLLYGSSGRLLSPEALTGRASEHFPPDSPALAGLVASRLDRQAVWDLHTAGPFWLDPMEGLMVPAPLTLLQEHSGARGRYSERRLEWVESDGDLRPSGWRPTDQAKPPRKAPSGGWIALADWELVGQPGRRIAIRANPWHTVPHLHPRLKDDERSSAGEGALFLEYGIAMQSGLSLAYLSSHAVEEGVYRFGGEGHLVQLRQQPLPALLDTLLRRPLSAPFALITPGIWGSPKLSLREPIDTTVPNGRFPWHRAGQAPGILTDKPRPWRHRLGSGSPKTDGPSGKRRLARGRWAMPAGSCYQLSGEPLEPWAEWNENWFPREGFSFKQLGTALALPLHPPP
ncbi:MAG: type III-B CRISPR module-associated Cmr3 family protein [Cyanobacteriota bacterium]|nr:type III-B CRISPR module-associated Cmr3 family protein [Cyanobacteriota bacterium]